MIFWYFFIRKKVQKETYEKECGFWIAECRIRSIWSLGSWAFHIDQGTRDDVSGIIDLNSNGQGDGRFDRNIDFQSIRRRRTKEMMNPTPSGVVSL